MVRTIELDQPVIITTKGPQADVDAGVRQLKLLIASAERSGKFVELPFQVAPYIYTILADTSAIPANVHFSPRATFKVTVTPDDRAKVEEETQPKAGHGGAFYTPLSGRRSTVIAQLQNPGDLVGLGVKLPPTPAQLAAAVNAHLGYSPEQRQVRRIVYIPKTAPATLP